MWRERRAHYEGRRCNARTYGVQRIRAASAFARHSSIPSTCQQRYGLPSLLLSPDLTSALSRRSLERGVLLL